MVKATAGRFQRMLKKQLDSALAELDQTYETARKDEVGELHNAMVECIADFAASPQNTLLVLEILKHETIEACIQQYYAQAQAVKLSHAEPTPLAAAGADGS